MKTKILFRTALAIAVATALAACNSNTSEEADTLSRSQPSVSGAVVTRNANQELEEIQVTGARIETSAADKIAAGSVANRQAAQSSFIAAAPAMEMRQMNTAMPNTWKKLNAYVNALLHW